MRQFVSNFTFDSGVGTIVGDPSKAHLPKLTKNILDIIDLTNLIRVTIIITFF